MSQPPFLPTAVLGGRKGDQGDQGDIGPSGGPFPDLTGVTAGKVARTLGAGAVEFVTLDTAIDTRIEATAARSNAGPLGRIWKAKSSQFVVHLYGMSIASFDNSPARVAGEQLRRIYGTVGERFEKGGPLGGSYSATYNGWEKQNYGGVGQVRARGKAASTALVFYTYGDVVDTVFSREADSEAVSVTVDGVSIGNTPAAGAQAYNQHVKATGLTMGLHKVVINVPAGAGYCYFEYLLGYDSTQPGVMVLDFTVGGTLLKQMTSVNVWPAATPPVVNSIATSGNNGIAGHYNRDDADLFINMHDVNDIFDPTTVEGAMPTILDYVNANKRHLVNVSSMAGHFALTGESGGTGYTRIRALYASLPKLHNYVTHVDWDGATRPTQAEVDDGTYAARYYTLPDFIHPGEAGTTVGSALFCKVLGIEPPAHANSTTVASDAVRRPKRPPVRLKTTTRAKLLDKTVSAVGATDVITLPKAHGLVVGDQVRWSSQQLSSGLYLNIPVYVKSVPSLNTLTVSSTVGGGGSTFDLGDKTDVVDNGLKIITGPPAPVGGYAKQLYANLAGHKIVPVHIDREAFNIYQVLNASIQSAPTGTDKYGKYKTLTNSNEYPTGGATLYQMPITTLTVTVAGALSIRPTAPWRVCAPDGTVPVLPPVGYDSIIAAADADSTVEPVTYTINIIDPTGASEYLVISATRLYEICWTFGDLPTLGC